MNYYIIGGVSLLLLTCWDYWRESTNAVTLFELFFDWWMVWITVDQESTPILYWGCIIIQALIGVGLILYGLVFG